jgi:hypothetical protein
MTNIPKPGPNYEYRVRHRRRAWADKQLRVARYFQTTWGLRQFVAKLRQPYEDLSPVVELIVERREVGKWEEVKVTRAGPIDIYQPPRGSKRGVV